MSHVLHSFASDLRECRLVDALDRGDLKLRKGKSQVCQHMRQEME